MEHWRRRLTVTADAQQAPDVAQEPDQALQDEGAAAAEYQYLPEGERREAGTVPRRGNPFPSRYLLPIKIPGFFRQMISEG